jgi:hypothetical protein
MVRDEAPGIDERGWAAWEIGSARCRAVILVCGPASFVAAEIHLGRHQQTATAAGCTATYKLRATPKMMNYPAISDGSE